MKRFVFNLKNAWWQSYVSIIIVLLLFIGFIGKVDYLKLKSIINKADSSVILSMLFLVIINYILRIYRFFLSARRLGVYIPFYQLSLCYLSGFAMSLTPGKIGELLRLWLIRERYGYGIEKTLPLQLSDRIMDACGALLLCVVGFSFFSAYQNYLLILAFLVFSTVLFLIKPSIIYWTLNSAYITIRLKGRFFARLRVFVRFFSKLFTPSFFLFSLALSCAGWLAECAALYLCVDFIDGRASFAAATFIFSFSNLAGAFTFLPGGLGGTELLMVALLKNIGVNFENAIIITGIIRMVTLWFGTVVGFIIFIFIKKQAVPSNLREIQ